MMRRLVAVACALGLVLGSAMSIMAGPIEDRITILEREIAALKEELARQAQAKAAPEPPPGPVAPLEQPAWAALAERVRLGAYGSVRFEGNSLDELKNTFTFRRFVLTVDGSITDRLRGLAEIEFERFTELELEKRTARRESGLRVEQDIEGSDQTELSLEQAWVQFDLKKWLAFRAGAILVPLGRFNIRHDDNLWDLPRRSLVDRGVPVLPAKAAWPELGLGFLGSVSIGKERKLAYEAYIMNGVTLDSTIETVVATRKFRREKLEAEVEVQPQRGTAALDSKNAKVGAGRIVFSPWSGQEIAVSGYAGRYTPDFLPSKTLWSLSADGKFTLGKFELEGEYVHTRFRGIKTIGRGVAQQVFTQTANIPSGVSPNFEAEVEFELANLASTKRGYWADLRYRFWPKALNETFLGKGFENPQIVLTVRGEQVFFAGLLKELAFTNGQVTNLERENRRVNRLTAGVTYRPTPLVAFQLAYENTWTNKDKSLANVTNFLPAKENEDRAQAVLFGVAFGF